MVEIETGDVLLLKSSAAVERYIENMDLGFIRKLGYRLLKTFNQEVIHTGIALNTSQLAERTFDDIDARNFKRNKDWIVLKPSYDIDKKKMKDLIWEDVECVALEDDYDYINLLRNGFLEVLPDKIERIVEKLWDYDGGEKTICSEWVVRIYQESGVEDPFGRDSHNLSPQQQLEYARSDEVFEVIDGGDLFASR